MAWVGGSSDEAALGKARLLAERTILPALGPGPKGLAYTRSLLADILWGAPRGEDGHHKAAVAYRIFAWVQGHLRYINDPVKREVFSTVPDILSKGLGDCDDFTTLLSALLLAAGIPVRARIIQVRGAWAHIYPVALLKGAWRPLDATIPGARPGWEYPLAERRLDVEVMP